MKIIKLGGSVITDKDDYAEPNYDAIRKLCRVLSSTNEEIILIHGAGSFGHVLALKYGLDRPGPIKEKTQEISRVMGDVLSLDSILIDELLRAKMSVVSIPPHAIYRSSKPDFRVVAQFLREGIVPVLFGDIIISGGKYRIISGDEIALDLATEFKPDSITFLTDVDGLYTDDPKKDKGAKLIKKIKATDITPRRLGRDATGSMKGKIENIKKMIPYTRKVLIINGFHPERFGSYARGKSFLGTVIT